MIFPQLQGKLRLLSQLRVADADSGLLAALTTARAQVARAEGSLPSSILPDPILVQIATHRPASLEALEQLEGMGASRVARYGVLLIDVVSGWRS
jgi:superfamily II DNA helicase RecQ